MYVGGILSFLLEHVDALVEVSAVFLKFGSFMLLQIQFLLLQLNMRCQVCFLVFEKEAWRAFFNLQDFVSSEKKRGFV